MKLKKVTLSNTKLRLFRKNIHNLKDVVYVIHSEKNDLYIHNKTNNNYFLIGEVINCTNKNDGEKMIIYTNGKDVFVRDSVEFYEKFTKYENL